MQPKQDLLALARFHGVEPGYLDAGGVRREASAEVLRGVLEGLGVAVGEPRRALRAAERARWNELLDPVAVAWGGRGALTVRVPERARGRLRFELRSEDGTVRGFGCALADAPIVASDGTGRERYVAKHVALPRGLRRGYYDVEVRLRAGGVERRAAGTVIAAPVRVHGLAPERREFGVFAPLYALRTAESAGSGDLGALRRLLDWTIERGGSAVGTLPLLAAFLEPPAEISPYLPVSRLAWNELYLEPAATAEWAGSPAARARLEGAAARAERRRVERGPLADPVAAMALRRPVIAALAATLFERGGRRREALEQFAAARPEIAEYARFRAACVQLGRPWQRWPARARTGRLRDGDIDAQELRYQLYAQWQLHEQLAALRRRGDAAGAVGLYLDVPLGVHGAGFDAWHEGELFASDLDTGAPPDALFSEGQNWGFPPPHPQRERERGHAYTRAVLRNMARYAGALRIDHVMGLHRRYVIPPGASARDGAYVRYAAEEHWAVLAVESRRARTAIVGEDLGTVPPEVRAALGRHGALGMHVLQYAAGSAGAPAGTLAALNTHDMPPFAGWLAGRDIALRQRLGTFDAAAARRERAARRRAVAMLPAPRAEREARGDAGARRRGLLRASLAALGASAAPLVVVALDDLLGATEAQNVPGTVDEHQNWRRRLRLPLERIESDPEVAAGIEALAAARERAGNEARYSAGAGRRAAGRSER
jgi:4-alpha-glucanotransferase